MSYASREFMLSKLEPMGLTGPTAAVSRNLVPVADFDDRHPTVHYSAALHNQKYEMDQRTQRAVQESLTNSQAHLYRGALPPSQPRVIAENPYDVWVDPRAHLFRETKQVVLDKELVAANEPWRIYSDARLGSIKHKDTK